MGSAPVRLESDLAIHPGELLAEELESRGMTQKLIASWTSTPFCAALLAGQSIG